MIEEVAIQELEAALEKVNVKIAEQYKIMMGSNSDSNAELQMTYYVAVATEIREKMKLR